MTPTCPTHHRPLICPCCVGARGGAKGGTATSPRKARAARKNGRKGGRPVEPAQAWRCECKALVEPGGLDAHRRVCPWNWFRRSPD